MRLALDRFEANLGRSRDLVATAKVLRAQTTSVLELSDLLRAALVLSVSALDHFVHELVLAGMLETFSGLRDRTPQFEKFPVSLNGLVLTGAQNRSDWLREEIKSKHGWLSFQTPDKIADALRLISALPIWSSVGSALGVDGKKLKMELSLIVDRRNKIAHEADSDPTLPGTHWPIDEQTVNGAIEMVTQIGRTIYRLVKL